MITNLDPHLKRAETMWQAVGGSGLRWFPPPRSASPPEPRFGLGSAPAELPPALAACLRRAMVERAAVVVDARDRRYLALPVEVEGEVVGVLLGESSRGLAPVAAEAVLRCAADLLADELARERELETMTAELADAYDQLVFMYRAAQLSRREGDLPTLLSELVREAVALLRAEAGYVVLAPTSPNSGWLWLPSPPQGAGLLLGQLRRALAGGTLLVNTPAEAAQVLPALTGARSVLGGAVSGEPAGGEAGAAGTADRPLAGGYPAAFLLFVNARSDGGFVAGNVKLLEAVSAQVGARIASERLRQALLTRERLRHELAIAARIQTNLMPSRMPRLPGATLVAFNQPATEVGGDFYDWIETPHGLAFALVDVSGKGMPAALLAGMVRTSLRAAFATEPSPARALARVNALLADDFARIEMFATAFAARYEPAARRLVLADAGHGLALWLCAQGAWEHLRAGGPPLGVLDDLELEDVSIDLAPGDRFAVFSDGLVEASAQGGEKFGLTRVALSLRPPRLPGLHGSLEASARAALRAVADFTGDLVEPGGATRIRGDDRTLLVLEVDPA